MRFLLVSTIDTLAISIFLYLLANFYDRRRRKGLSYPPGPPSWPIMSNFFDIPKNRPWIEYTDMSKKYGRHVCETGSNKLIFVFQGDVICFRVFSKVIVVLSSLSAIKDLLEKRGEIYSERPTLPIVEMYAQKCHYILIIFLIHSSPCLG